MRITMYHPFYSRSALGIVSLSDYITRNHRLQLFFQLYNCTFFLMGYEKIISLGFKQSAKKNQFIFSKSCNLLVTMIQLNSSKGSKMISRRPSIGCIDYSATKYFRKRMKLSNRNSNTYVGCLMSMFSQETYLNKEIL